MSSKKHGFKKIRGIVAEKPACPEKFREFPGLKSLKSFRFLMASR